MLTRTSIRPEAKRCVEAQDNGLGPSAKHNRLCIHSLLDDLNAGVIIVRQVDRTR